MNALAHIDVNAKVSTQDLVAKYNELVDVVNNLSAPRDRGPKSDKTMTDEHAREVIMGSLKDASHKDAATALGLSYGQVYSARKGFTFKGINKEAREAAKE